MAFLKIKRTPIRHPLFVNELESFYNDKGTIIEMKKPP